ncbi:MAG TPA: GGDEF domain-containing protein [Gammaproteobacteria bacterium]|nr:GGDEF domain-containing protein [Gammaproteobacteria bacterium]
MTRAQMLLFALLAMHLLLGVLVLAVSWSERRSRALRLWGSGLIAYAIGALLTIATGLLPWGLRQVAGDSLISLAALLTALGMYQHASLRLGRATLIGSFAFIVAVLTANHVLGMTVFIDIAAPTVYASVLYFAGALALWRSPPLTAKAAARYLAVIAMASIIVWNLRMYSIWVSLGGTSDKTRADYAFSLFAIAQMLLLVASTLGMLWIEVRKIESDLLRSAYTDILTGLPNRRAMLLRFHEQLSGAQRQQQKFGFAVLDLDHFKEINDTCGHQAGDRMLQHVADTMNEAKRGEDVLGRIGGEEFLLFLPHHDRAAAVTAVERLREAMTLAALPENIAFPKRMTLSGGIAVYPDDGKDWDSLFTAADRRLYLAKGLGRNRVESQDAAAIGSEDEPADDLSVQKL